MWLAKQALTFGLELLGAVVFAAMVAALAAPGSHYPSAVPAALESFARLDFGTSGITGSPAAHEVLSRLPATFELVVAGILIALLVGVPLGLLLGRRPLRLAAPLLQLVMAAPVFCAGLGLMWIATHVFHLSYASGPLPWPAMASGGVAALAALHSLSLPGLTVGAAGAGAVQLALRRRESAAMAEPYRSGLRRMGLSALEIDRLYLLPQMFAGLLAESGEIALALFSAAAVAEWLFGWPGAAVLFLKSVALHDWNVAALALLVFAAVSLFAGFCGKLAARALGDREAG